MQKKGRAGTSRAGKIALYGMMTALAFLLSYVETLIPLNLGVPGIKLGLANLASIVSLYLLGAGAAAAIALVRIVLVGFTFGNLSMMLYSLAGAAVSLLLMVVFRRLDWFGVTGVASWVVRDTTSGSLSWRRWWWKMRACSTIFRCFWQPERQRGR